VAEAVSKPVAVAAVDDHLARQTVDLLGRALAACESDETRA
jgi:hypothetical protein